MFHFFKNKNKAYFGNRKFYFFKEKFLHGFNFFTKLFILSGILFILFFLFYSDFFKVSGIAFERNNFSVPEKLITEIKKTSGKNIFFLNLGNIEKKLQKKYFHYKKIKLYRKFPDKIGLKVEKYDDLFILHTFFIKKDKKNDFKEKFTQQFFLTESGEISFFEKGKKFKKIFYKDSTKKQLGLGEKIFSRKEFEDLKFILKTLEKFYFLKIEFINYFGKAQEVHFKTNIGNIWITFSKDVKKQLDKIFLLQEKFGKNKKYEYLDLRILGKIIYKEN